MAREIGLWLTEPQAVMLEARIRALEVRLRAVEEQLAGIAGHSADVEQDKAGASREVTATGQPANSPRTVAKHLERTYQQARR